MRASRRVVVSATALLIGSAVVGWSGSARAGKDIHSFTVFAQGMPFLTADRAGNLYGLIADNGSTLPFGAVYRLVPPAAEGQPWTRQILHKLGGNQGYVSGNGVPNGKLALDAAGNIYGVCVGGSRDNTGTAWRLSPPTAPGGAWTFARIFNFTSGSPGGIVPAFGLVIDHTGTLYGTTTYARPYGSAAVFSLIPPPVGGTKWTETVLHVFALDTLDVGGPLVLSSHDTVLTGVAIAEDDENDGEVFRLRRRNNAWTYRLLYQFPWNGKNAPAPGGASPVGPVVVDQNDNIFGVAAAGGSANYGVVFELLPPAPGQSAWTEQVIYNFTSTSGGPVSGLVAGGSPPALFGTTTTGTGTAVDGSTGTVGQVFRLDPPASGTGPWTYTALHTFDGAGYQSEGFPGPLTFGLHRFLYGVSSVGGKYNRGAVVQVSPHIPASPPAAAAP